jgi:CAAX protease family protein
VKLPEWRWLRSDLDAISPARLAEPPPRSGAAASATILAAVAVFAGVGALAGGITRMPLWALGVLVALLLVARRLPEPYPLHVTLLCTLGAFASVTRGFGIHPFPLFAAMCAYGVIVLVSPRLRLSADWAHSGTWDAGSLRLALLTALLPLVGLPLWRALSLPDLEPLVAIVAGIPAWALPFIGLGFALLNALVEEIAFRGVLLDGLMSAVGVRAAVVLQAAAFGLVHLDGLPGGVLGVVLSGLYGLILGAIRLRTRGLATPYVAHVLADLVLFAWLVVWAQA